MKNYLIFGASQGLGDAFARGLPGSGDRIWLVSRSRPSSLELQDGAERIWIPADLSEPGAAKTIFDQLQNEKLDVAVYNVGIWEKKASRITTRSIKTSPSISAHDSDQYHFGYRVPARPSAESASIELRQSHPDRLDGGT